MNGRQIGIAIVSVIVAAIVVAVALDAFVISDHPSETITDQITALERTVTDTARTVAVNRQTGLIIGVGTILGAGLGAFLGSSITYRYWRDQL